MLRRRLLQGAGGGSDYVDLGLPSGMLWAKGNLIKNSNSNYAIGAETDWGTYISWGNIIGHNEGEGYDFSSTNYNSTPGKQVSANIPSTDAAHDIARATLGTPWHLPTKADFQELYDNTDSEWVADYNGTGVAGRKFMKKSDHTVYIFFPASGSYNGETLLSLGTSGLYWSASFLSATSAYSLSFSSSSVSPQNYNVRRYGRSVRGCAFPYTVELVLKDGNNNVIAGELLTVTTAQGTVQVTTDYHGKAQFGACAGACTVVSANYTLASNSFTITGDNTFNLTTTGSLFVNLGLPSGKKWAKGNLVKDANGNYSIGAETDWGTYISWGNIDGHNYGEGYDFSSTNYNSSPGSSVAADIPSTDAAHDVCFARLGAPWHLPTKEDFQELYDNTDSEWVADYNGTGVAGRKFMKKTDHTVYIFFPASGYYNGTSLYNLGTSGYYWSASFYSATSAYGLYFSSSDVNPQYHYVRRYGRSVRPVQ